MAAGIRSLIGRDAFLFPGERMIGMRDLEGTNPTCAQRMRCRKTWGATVRERYREFLLISSCASFTSAGCGENKRRSHHYPRHILYKITG